MFYRAKRALRRAWFDLQGRAILDTPPLPACDHDRLTLVSMVCHGEVFMYLLAAKSFCRQLGFVPQVVILNDGSLTPQDQSTLSTQIPHVRILSIQEISTGSCPKGSCWERLLLINELSESSYIVQLDSDTLTLGPVLEVLAAIEANHSFTLLGDRSFPHIEPMLDACARSQTNLHSQIQAVCERTFHQIPESASLKYVRGNAGFTGFAQGSLSTQAIEHFSGLMQSLTGQQWNQWGSEQVTSNLLIANTPDAVTLPFPRYLSYWAHPDVPYRDAAFIHFIGPHRYSHGFYRAQAAKALEALKH